MVRRLRRLLSGEVASLTAAGLVGAISTFVFWLVAARRAPLLLIGHTTSVVVAGSVINAVSSFGLTVGLLREKAHGGLHRSTLRAGMVLSTTGSAVVSVVALALWPSSSLDALHLTSPTLYVHLFGLSGGLALSVVIDTVAAGFGLPRLAIVRNLTVLVLRIVTVLTLHDLTCSHLLYAFWLPMVVTTLCALPVLWRRGDLHPTATESPRRALRESFRAWPTSLVFNAVAMVPPLVVTVVNGPADGAVFYLLWNTALLANSLIGAWTSLGLRENSPLPQRRSRVMSILEMAVVWGVATVTAVVGIVAVVAYGAEYRQLGLAAAPLIGLGIVPYGILQFRVLALRRHGQHRRAAMMTASLLTLWMVGLLIVHPTSLVDVALWWCGAGVVALIVSSPRSVQRHSTV